jgi:hypothetical protein
MIAEPHDARLARAHERTLTAINALPDEITALLCYINGWNANADTVREYLRSYSEAMYEQ